MDGWVGYETHSPLDGYYFEDSYVLCVWASKAIVEFTLLAALTSGHPAYQAPLPGEHHCYRYARLRFSGCSDVCWLDRSPTLSVDPDGEADFGNLDTFLLNQGRFRLQGSWGHLEFAADDWSIGLIDT
ncbi:MAG: hypothetical protein AB7O49_17965 [Sphingomonadales bacterium]